MYYEWNSQFANENCMIPQNSMTLH